MSVATAPRRWLGRYELLLTLGQGGMGEVHLAKLSGAGGFEKLCIVKTILPKMQSDPQFVARFHHEARVLVHLNHSHIAQVYDMGEVDGTFYMAIEYVPGVDLSRVQSRTQQAGVAIPVPIAVYLAQQVCEGLGYAHRKAGPDGAPLSIVHRDVSPQNVMVSYEGEVKIIDFGLAKSAARSQHTLPSTVMGKLGYMSPEQATAQPLDHRSDIYSAGIVIWEMFAGRALFEGGTMAEMVVNMANPKIPLLRDVRPDIDPSLEAVVMGALAIDPVARYERAEAFGRALNEWVVSTRRTVGAEEVGNYVRAMCPEEYAAERALQSKLSMLRRRANPDVASDIVAEAAGTVLRSAPRALGSNPTAAQLALSAGARSREPEREPGAEGPAGSVAEPMSANVEIPRNRAPFVVAGVLGVVAVAALAALWFRSQPQPPALSAQASRPPAGAVVDASVARQAVELQPQSKGDESPTAQPTESPPKQKLIDVSGPVFAVRQDEGAVFALLKKGAVLREGDELQLVGEVEQGKAALYAEGAVLKVRGLVASIALYQAVDLPQTVFAFRPQRGGKSRVSSPLGKPGNAGRAPSSAAKLSDEGSVLPSVEAPRVAVAEVPKVAVAEAPKVADVPKPAAEPDNGAGAVHTKPLVQTSARSQEVAAQGAARPKAVVRGSVQFFGRKGAGQVRVTNSNTFSLTGCTLRLPGNVASRLSAEIYANKNIDIPLSMFSPDVRPPDPQFAKGWAPIYCAEGTGYLRVYDLRK